MRFHHWMCRWLLIGGVLLMGGRFTVGEAEPDIWQPTPGMTWQIQFSGTLDTSIMASVYDVDLFDTPTETVAALHAQGRKVICYLSAGSWEDWRPDAGDFPNSVLGNDYVGWAGEKWLDIRRIDLLAPIMEARLDLCAAKGFDGVDPDNINAYSNDTGFPLTYADQLAYNLWLADAAHARGLSIGLKNAPEMIPDLLAHYEWTLTEECFEQGWCEETLPFIDAGKAVFAIEYTDGGMTTGAFCPDANALHISGILKHRNLDAWIKPCYFIPSQTAPQRNRYQTATPTLLWGGVPWATGYEIQVDNSAAFSSLEFKTTSLGAGDWSVVVSALDNGVYYWRVRAKRLDGTWGAWSATESFVIYVI